jgi:hypothetical protein
MERRVQWILALAVLAGCSNGSRFDPPTTTVSGTVVMGGPVTGSAVSLYLIDASTRKLSRVASAQTSAAGSFSITTMVGGSAFLLVASGGSYREDATGAATSLSVTTLATLDDPRTGVLEAMVGSGLTPPGTCHVTPLTTIASRRVVYLSLTGGAGALAETSVLPANQAVTLALNVGSTDMPVDPRALAPLDFTNPADAALIKQNPHAPAALYGAALSGLSELASAVGLPSTLPLVDALALDFTDGVFDGMSPGTNGTPVPVALGSGTLSPTTASTGLDQATATFLNSSTVNVSGATAASLGPQ